jgi:hypothetical protein
MTEGMIFYLAFVFVALIYPIQNQELQAQLDEYTVNDMIDMFWYAPAPVPTPTN